MKDCICPVVVITCYSNHVSEDQMRMIAATINASVTKKCIDGGSMHTMYAPHRKDCPCHPDNQ